MRISGLEIDQVENFLNFNKKIYPQRNNERERFQYHLINNPLLKDKTHPYGFLAFNENNEIVGQFLLNPCEFYFSGQDYKGFFGCDYYVLEGYRGALGAFLAFKTIRSSKSYFAIGVTEIAQKIHLSLGTKIIGSLEKFIWFRNFFSPILVAKSLIAKNNSSLAKYNKNNHFPENLFSLGKEFKLVEYLDTWDNYHWNNTLEFSRSLEFLKWRFFGNLKGYYFYLSKDPKNLFYFTVRKSIWRGLFLIIIVDYKIPFQDKDAWKAILNASKLLAKLNNSDGVLTLSSHKFFDEGLRKEFFLKIGNPNLILTNVNINFSIEDAKRRNLVYATMADSDTDLNFDEALLKYSL